MNRRCAAVLLLLAAPAAGAAEPEDVLREFYGLIAGRRCEEAAALASGYRAERCRRIESIALEGPVERRESAPGRVVLNYGLRYRRLGESPVSARYSVPLSAEPSGWRLDMAGVKQLPAPPPPAIAAIPLTVPGPSAPPAPPRPPILAPPPAGPTAKPPAPAPPPSGLLSLWTWEELRGRPGEERIRLLPSPDRAPPAFAAGGALPDLPAEARRSLRRVKLPAQSRQVALTFDLCEQSDEVAGYDRAIVNTLREKNIRATFFAGGKWMRSHPERTQQLMADPRFELGNHAWTHGNLRVLKGRAMEEQILWTQAEYRNQRQRLKDKAAARGLAGEAERIATDLRLFRFPYGTCSAESLDAVNRQGLAAVQWDVVSGDPGGIAPVRRLVEAVKPGSIVVLHANGRGKGTAKALPALIEGLARKGYRFVTVSELLEQGPPEAVDECYEVKPGDNGRYDALFGAGTERPKPRQTPPPAGAPTRAALKPR